MLDDEIRKKLQEYSFYHIIRLTENIETPGLPAHVPGLGKTLRALAALSLAGKRVLDIGCRDGLLSFDAEKRGAREVIGIDNDLSTAAVEFLIPFFGSKVRMHALNLYDLRRDTFGTFDVVIFAGVLYHLRFPFHALKLIRDVMEDGGTLVLETAVFVDDNRFSMLYCPVGEESPYEPTSVTFFNVKGLKDSLLTLGFKVESFELQTNIPPDPSGKEKAIDRVVMTCTATPQRQDLAKYWEGTHDLHSTGARGAPGR